MITSSSSEFCSADKINTGTVHQLSASAGGLHLGVQPSSRAPR